MTPSVKRRVSLNSLAICSRRIACTARYTGPRIPMQKFWRFTRKDALAVPGVVDVLTWRDIPGENYFGIGAPDQPVLCRDKTRFIGDPIAVVIAETEAVARAAVQQISIS